MDAEEGAPTLDAVADFERDPFAAQALFWRASGHGRVGSALEQLGRPLTQLEEAVLVTEACKAMDPYQRIVACAACGERAFGKEGLVARPDASDTHYIVNLFDRAVSTKLAAVFAATPEVLARRDALPPHLRRMIHVYEGGVQRSFSPPLSLYSEHINEAGRAGICARCFAAALKPRVGRVPMFSLAAGWEPGVDLPALLDLPRRLTPGEHLAISLTCVVSVAIKIVPGETAALNGHMFAVPQDSPVALAAALPHLDLARRVAVYFVGTAADHERARASGRLSRAVASMMEVREELCVCVLCVCCVCVLIGSSNILPHGNPSRQQQEIKSVCQWTLLRSALQIVSKHQSSSNTLTR